MERIKVQLIIGSTRRNRYADKPAAWVVEELKGRGDVDVEIVDLRDHPLPFYDEPIAPMRVTDGGYENEEVRRFGARIAKADAYVVTAAEYNHGYTAVLKNALDCLYHEWTRKPVTFVGWGGANGARAIEQLRQVAVELQMAPIQLSVNIPLDVFLATRNAPDPADPALWAPLRDKAHRTFDQLAWWAHALRAARRASDAGSAA